MSRQNVAKALAVGSGLFMILMYVIPVPESISRILARVGLLRGG